MFATIARIDIRFRWLIVAVWLVGVVAGGRLLPGLTSVIHASNGQFLPPSSPSVQATRLAAPFQVVEPNQTATIVVSRASGPLTAADGAAISQVEQAMRQVPGVASVRETGTSPDGRAAQAVVTVPGSVSSTTAPPAPPCALAAGLVGFRTTSDLSSPPPDGSDSAAGACGAGRPLPAGRQRGAPGHSLPGPGGARDRSSVVRRRRA